MTSVLMILILLSPTLTVTQKSVGFGIDLGHASKGTGNSNHHSKCNTSFLIVITLNNVSWVQKKERERTNVYNDAVKIHPLS